MTFAVVLLVSTAAVGYGYVSATSGQRLDLADRADGGRTTDSDLANRSGPAANGTTRANVTMPNASVARSLDGRPVTVVATQGFYVSDETAELLAVTGNGTVVYYEDRYRVYFDVDPVADTRYTVEYVAAKHFNGSTCESVGTDRCTRNVVRRVNLTTGASSTVYAELTPGIASTRWHDVDRLNETHLVVADIVHDRVTVVDQRSGAVTWEWRAEDDFSRESGGQAGDWTHVNDVEVLPDGRIMASLRNQDAVVFLDPGRGLLENWTLGEDDRHETLYEQHNPDYIPASRGGPAVIVADSENNRVVEYHRENGTWSRTWQWRDARLQWPRDADRRPDGSTLIVDSHGDRVLSVGPYDTVRWSLTVGMPYDVERLDGDRIRPTDGESTGPVASRRLAAAQTDGTDAPDPARSAVAGASDGVWLTLKSVLPPVVVNGALYVSPPWVRFSDLAFATLFVLTGFAWLSVEFRWSRYSVRGLLGRVRSRLPSRR